MSDRIKAWLELIGLFVLFNVAFITMLVAIGYMAHLQRLATIVPN